MQPVVVGIGAVDDPYGQCGRLPYVLACPFPPRGCPWDHGPGPGLPGERVQLQPFGFVARLERAGGWDGLAIAAAGPFSLLMTGGMRSVKDLGSLPFLAAFGQANLSIALLNLLPALPLDGGRMLRCLLQPYLSPRACIRVCAGLGLLAGAGLLLLGGALLIQGERNATVVIFGLFYSGRWAGIPRRRAPG